MPPAKPPPITPRPAQRAPAASVLANAFADYPFFTYALPDPASRVSRLQVLFEVMVAYAQRYAQIYATSDQLEGVMCALPPAARHPSNWGMVRSGATKIPFKMGIGFIRRQDKVGKVIESLRATHAPFPHAYLWLLGVQPGFTGQGHATRLVRHLLTELTPARTPCYLETGLERNVRLYEHLGFKVMERREIPALRLTMWAMLWRPA